MLIPIKFKKLNSKAKLPFFASKGAVCFDLHACIMSEILHIEPNSTTVVKTGLACEVPEGYELQIRSRSGIACAGVSILNSPGTIDSDYRGEIGIIMHNHNNVYFIIEDGDRIAQGAVRVVPKIEIVEVEELSETERGENGFGSTGL